MRVPVKMNKLLILVVFLGSLAGYKYGSVVTENKYILELQEISDESDRLRESIRKKNTDHQIAQEEHLLEIQKLRGNYEDTINNLTSEYDSRLLESEKRSNLYRERFAPTSTECEILAEHTSRLDRTLTEGRELVKRLREHIKQSELTYSEVIKYLINDRNHLNG